MIERSGELLDEFAARLGGFLGERGFEAGEWTFRRYGASRDALIIEFQTARLWSPEEAYFHINVSFSLRPKWEYDRVRLEFPDDEPPRGSLGVLLDRIEPASPYEDCWRVVDEATRDHVFGHVCRQIDRALPGWAGLLDRTELLARAGKIIGAGKWRWQAWILAERGPSAELDQLLAAQDAPHIVDAIRSYALTRPAA